ncbi:MAG: two-component sensor histidine kinase, partial [Spirochaetes bacterium]
LGAIILAGVLVGIISSRRLLSPIVRLNQEIDHIIITGDLGRRLDSSGTGDQLDGLINRYNRLLDRVESLIGGMKDTLDAVAHDLRTPLTRLRGHAELALGKGDAEEYEEALATVVEQTDQAGALLSALMDIAEAEQGMLSLEGVSCNLSTLAAEVSDMYELIAEEKGQRLTLEAPNEVLLSGDPVRLRQILGNLVDNALKYSPEGSCIDIRCGFSDETSWAEIIDDGPGVPEEETERVFERLYRGDRSRGSRGLGLGLSMVKALVEAHSGSVEISKVEGRGASFKVVFPRISEENISKA